ncbi:MAG: hypothetical protein HKN79_03505 [Flavobacteriales bacterium]|nr:hypothetical protein [Flavobacteriales bacterium]
MACFYACDKDNSFPPTPYIEYEGVELIPDTAIIQLYFRDGDGDIGSLDSDGCPPYDIYFDYEEMVDGEWTPVDRDYNWCVNSLTPQGQDKTLEGDIFVSASLVSLSENQDSIRFILHLRDRAGNESNAVTTPLITP